MKMLIAAFDRRSASLLIRLTILPTSAPSVFSSSLLSSSPSFFSLFFSLVAPLRSLRLRAFS